MAEQTKAAKRAASLAKKGMTEKTTYTRLGAVTSVVKNKTVRKPKGTASKVGGVSRPKGMY